MAYQSTATDGCQVAIFLLKRWHCRLAFVQLWQNGQSENWRLERRPCGSGSPQIGIESCRLACLLRLRASEPAQHELVWTFKNQRLASRVNLFCVATSVTSSFSPPINFILEALQSPIIWPYIMLLHAGAVAADGHPSNTPVNCEDSSLHCACLYA